MTAIEGAESSRADAATGVPAPRRQVRSFHPRRGRVTATQADALARLWPRFGFEVESRALRPDLLFGREAGVVLEIGSGMGDTTLAMAEADPDRDYLAVDVHTPGLGALLAGVEAKGLSNVRVARGDAVELLRDMLEPRSLDAVHILFPDPWPKKRHHKRRLVNPEIAALIADRLRPGGLLHTATDCPDYANRMLIVLTATRGLVNTCPEFAPRPVDRPVSKFERRALQAGRTVNECAFQRV
jgi:tRNA (guanine-N7-)-methyltransferase